VRAWRIEKNKYLAAAASGEGARREGGRWNSAGLPVVYTSEHLSLAVLEILANASSPAARMARRSRCVIAIPEDAVETVSSTQLPGDYGPRTPYAVTRALGDAWLLGNRSPVLAVPSAIIPVERNLLLNPNHPRFPDLAWESFEEIHLDTRLWLAGPEHNANP